VRSAAKVRSLVTTCHTRIIARRAGSSRIFNRFGCNFQAAARVACEFVRSASKAARSRKPH